MEPEIFDLISLFSGIFLLIVIALSLSLHELKIWRIKKRDEISEREDSIRVKISAPRLWLLSWIFAIFAFLFISLMSIILHRSEVSFIISIISIISLGILFLLFFVPLGKIVLSSKTEKTPETKEKSERKGGIYPIYQEIDAFFMRSLVCRFSELSFIPAIISLFFTFRSYSDSVFYCQGPGYIYHLIAFFFLLVCIFLLFLPILIDPFKLFVKILKIKF